MGMLAYILPVVMILAGGVLRRTGSSEQRLLVSDIFIRIGLLAVLAVTLLGVAASMAGFPEVVSLGSCLGIGLAGVLTALGAAREARSN